MIEDVCWCWELERRQVDGRVILGMRRYEDRICVDSPPSHFFNTSRHTDVNLYIYIPVLWTRRDRVLAAAYIVLLDKQYQRVCHYDSVTILGSSTTVV